MDSLTVKSSIAEFFENQSVFITGVTGVIGKVILFKLLKSCPHISNIYVLIRDTKEKRATERLSDIFGAEPFRQLLAERTEVRERVTALCGNIVEVNLGMNSIDLERLCEGISVVIHAAACNDIDETIQRAMEMNVKGTWNMLQMARKIKNLQAFVHVSSVYSVGTRAKTEEVIYPTSVTPQAAAELFDGMTEEEILAGDSNILEGRPNASCFTISLAEQLVDSHRKELPVCIVRPSTVAAAHREPFPGWVDSWRTGVTGFFGFILHGFQQFLYVPSEYSKLDLIPVDHAVNLVLAASWFTATAPKTGREPYFVYNCCSGGKAPLSVEKALKLIQKAAWITPFPSAYRFPSVSLVRSKWLYRFYDAVFLFLPCQLIDLKDKVMGRAEGAKELYRKMLKTHRAFCFFTMFECNYTTENAFKLQDQLNLVDKQLFSFDSGSIRWEPYMYDCIEGIRKYILHGAEEQLDTDRARYKRLYIVSFAYRGLMACLLLVGFLTAWHYWRAE